MIELMCARTLNLSILLVLANSVTNH